MNNIVRMSLVIAGAAALGACAPKKTESFRYTVDQFADLKIIRYQIPGWDGLSLGQKAYAYHLAEAAKWGRDITWDQYCAWNLPVRHALEAILQCEAVDRSAPEYADFLVYAKRVFFSNGVHHHYAEDKFFPDCPKEYFASLMNTAGVSDEALLDFIYDRNALVVVFAFKIFGLELKRPVFQVTEGVVEILVNHSGIKKLLPKDAFIGSTVLKFLI